MAVPVALSWLCDPAVKSVLVWHFCWFALQCCCAKGRGSLMPARLTGLSEHCISLTTGSGADEDIVVASVRAYIGALNKMIGWLSVSSRNEPSGHKRQLVSSSGSEVQVAIKH